MLNLHTIVVTPLEQNCSVLWADSGQCIVVDPGGDLEQIRLFLELKQLKPDLILNTHGHIDHIGANAELRSLTGAQIAIHPQDAPMLSSRLLCGADWLQMDFTEHQPDFLLKEGEATGTSDIPLEVFHVPGHSPGSVMFLNRQNRILLGGDLVFRGGVGRWDLPGGDEAMLFQSIAQKFLPLDDDLRVYPGHGPSTTVGHERRTNPYLLALSRNRA